MADYSDPYLVKGTGDTDKLLRNKLGITDRPTLQRRETFLSAQRISEIRRNPGVLGKIDKPDQALLQKVHEYIFQDVYHKRGEHKHPIAGAIREIGIAKVGDPIYPTPDAVRDTDNLDKRLEYAFSRLEKDDYLKGLDDKKFASKLAQHATEIWEVHPHREGNSRTTAVFSELIAINAGKKLQPIGRDFRENLKHASKNIDYGPLIKLVSDALAPPNTAPVIKNAKEASQIINTATEKTFKHMMSPIVAQRKTLVARIDQIKRCLLYTSPSPRDS